MPVWERTGLRIYDVAQEYFATYACCTMRKSTRPVTTQIIAKRTLEQIAYNFIYPLNVKFKQFSLRIW
jgi:hypothetical protein